MKICSKCKIEKEESEFYKRKMARDGLRSNCKNCISLKKKQHYQNNKDEILQQRKQYYQIHQEVQKEYAKKYCKQYYQDNKEKISERMKQYYQDNREEISQRQKQYNQINKENGKEYINQYYKQRRQNDYSFKLRRNISCLIRFYLKRNNSSKQESSILEYLPYTIQQLKQHLEFQFESWMNWDNYGIASLNKQTWHIDHIIPQSKLPYDSMEHSNFQKCWALENLRPLGAIENIRKGNK
jgi:hypothetical protein